MHAPVPTPFASTEEAPVTEHKATARELWARAKPAKSGVSVTPIFVLLGATWYGVLYFAMGSVWLPDSPAFAALLIWVCAVAAADVVRWVRLPRVIGMLGIGLLLINVPNSPIAAFPKKWGVQMRAAALATIFLRCGLELEFETIRLYKWPALRLAFIPGLCEAFFDGGLAVVLFGMPVMLAFSLGFILKAVGPGLVVPAMFQLQKRGLGAGKGIPSTVVISASFDDIIAITGFSIFINIAIVGQDNLAWSIARGPLQVLFGLIGGVIAGIVLGCTRLFNTRAKRLIGIYGACLLIMFLLESFDMLSGGALGALAVGLAACWCWESGFPTRLSHGPNSSHSADIERVIAKVWDWVWEPLLFGTIGASIKFSTLEASVVPKAVIIVVSGLAVRVITTYVTMFGSGYSWKEQLFYAIAWTPKATVQASLSSFPLAVIQTTMSPTDPDYELWVSWGEAILTTGVFAIIICATLGTTATQLTASHLLLQEATQERTDMSRVPSTKVMDAHGGAQGGAGAAAGVSGRSVLSRAGNSLSLEELRLVDGDSELLSDYFHAIDALLDAVRCDGAHDYLEKGRGRQAAVEALTQRVMALQQQLDHQLGSREMTVRQMLANAALRSTSSTAAQISLAPGGSKHSQLMATLHELAVNDVPVSSAEVAHTIAAIMGDGDGASPQAADGDRPAAGRSAGGRVEGGSPLLLRKASSSEGGGGGRPELR